MKTVILCGGEGTRLKEETEFRPKPLVPIGKYPIIWHIMKLYNNYGFSDFILPLGYRGTLITEYFMNYRWQTSDVTFNIKSKETEYHNLHAVEDWNITFVDTGLKSMTAKRLHLVKRYLEGEDTFMLTYGDGVSDVNVEELLKFHKEHGKLVTVTGINPASQYGVIDVDVHGIAQKFQEKPDSLDLINGGFMVFNKEIWNHITDEDVMLEALIGTLTKKGLVTIFHHKGFWHSMDTYRDYLKLNKLWEENNRPWAVWEKN